MVKQKKRKAGRPKKYPTKTVRIPEAIEEEVNELKLGYELMWDGKTKTIHPMPLMSEEEMRSHSIGIMGDQLLKSNKDKGCKG